MATKRELSESMFWADQLARTIVSEKGKKKQYVCAAGITPSGTIHIGNFREIITVDLVARALKDMGKKVRFIYSWDDYDRLRKIPANVPDRKKLEKFILKPIIMTPDPWGCHKSYAEHFEKEVESVLPRLGIKPEFINQNKMYRKCAYTKEIKKALENTQVIKEILNSYRKEPLGDDWMPLRIYCEKCNYETTKPEKWDGGFIVTYSCKCGHRGKVDFSKKGLVKLPWRVDWPMRWFYEKVDFEPAGKEHSTPGGSRTVGAQISEKVYNYEPPVYQMYDFIILRSGGKMSGSEGRLFSIGEIADIYMPEVLRFLFAGTKPKKEFAIPVNEEIFKVYEDFYETERIYYGKEKRSKKETLQRSRIYEMSCVDRPPGKSMPVQVNFRHAVTLINIYGDTVKALQTVKAQEGLNKNDEERYGKILACAKNWIEEHAPEKYIFRLQEKPSVKLASKEKKAVLGLAQTLEKKPMNEKELFNAFYSICEKTGISNREFFKAVYRVLIGKESGPRLAPFILAVGRQKVAKILKQVK